MPKAKCKNRSRMATPEAASKTRQRMATPEEKSKACKRMATPDSKSRTSKRMATPEAKTQTRSRLATPVRQEKNKQNKATRRSARRLTQVHRVLQAQAQRQEEVLTSEGTWATTARSTAEAQGSQAVPSRLPPAFAALHNEGCLAFVREMYEALHCVQWQTCVVCWRAWFDVPRTYEFSQPVAAHSSKKTWFDFYNSSVLRASKRKDVDHWFLSADQTQDSHAQAAAFLNNNYDHETCARLLNRLVDTDRKRGIVVCPACATHVHEDRLCAGNGVRLCDYVVDPVYTKVCDQALPVVVERWHAHSPEGENEEAPVLDARPMTPVLGLSLQEFAAPIAQLTDQEEMVISLIHPLVQVYTLPCTGQLAYVGHVCNFPPTC